MCSSYFEAKHADALFCREACEVKNRRKQASRRVFLATSGNNEWHSPAIAVEPARLVMGGIDLDPASCAAANAFIDADRYYDQEEDGLEQQWFGRCWINPPYGKLAPLVARRFREFYPGPVTMACWLLSNHHESTQWFHDLVAGLDHIICKPWRRLPFGGKKDPAHGSMIVGFGVDPDRFRDAFKALGRIYEERA